MTRDEDHHRGQTPSLYSVRLEAAVRLAAQGHHDQFRKNLAGGDPAAQTEPLPSDRVPYVTHLMGTLCILARLDGGDDLLAAAVLHDYLEDVPDPDGPGSIVAAAGPRVLELVEAVTEDKRPQLAETASWELRKQEQIDRLGIAPPEAVMVKTADLLHNMVSLLADLDASDDPATVWTRFNAAPDRQLWYFDAVIRAARARLGPGRLTDEAERVAGELRRRAEAWRDGSRLS